MEWRRGDYLISDDPARVDLAAVHDFLSNGAYWSPGVPLDVVRRAIAGSVVFGLYWVGDGGNLGADDAGDDDGGEQVGFTRVVTDRATFAWICDVYVLDTHRGHGLGKWLIETVRAHPDLQGLRRWLLATSDAHALYEQFGFVPAEPGRLMEIRDIDMYRRVESGEAADPG